MRTTTFTLLAWALLSGAALAEKDETLLVSRAGGIDGAKGNFFSTFASVSADGRFVAFASRATNLHPDDGDMKEDVFVRDLQAHETILVSRAAGIDGVKGNDASTDTAISADGRRVAFHTAATNLHPDDTDDLRDVFVRNLETGETILVSRAGGVAGAKGNAFSRFPSISADGRFVAFTSEATNLHPADTDGDVDVFVRDLRTHETLLVSRAAGVDGVKGNGNSFQPAISADGRHVAFASAASNLDPDDTDTFPDVFVRDLRTHETILVSRAGRADGVKGDSQSGDPSVAAIGRYVAFHSTATNLHPDDTDGVQDVFVRDTLGPPPLAPVALEIDYAPFDSDGNGVLEPGEIVDVAPVWRNDADIAWSLSGLASDLVGPPLVATYTLWRDDAHYGAVQPGERAGCRDFVDLCYAVGVDAPTRPVLHWDATLRETLSDPLVSSHVWNLHVGDSFADVPRSHRFYRTIETLLHHGVTSGCGEDRFCPSAGTTRAQMAVFTLWASEGSGYAPPHCAPGFERFSDVPATNPFCPWIEEMARRGVLAGCGGGAFCPAAPVTRAQAAVYVLGALEGVEYTPPPCVGVFADVPCPSPFADWIEELAARGVTSGCGEGGYCPSLPITRGQMSIYLTTAYDLTLYGP